MPLARATAETPETPNRPANYIIQKLDQTEDPRELQALRDHAVLHGYTGQTLEMIDEKLADTRPPRRGRGK